MQTIFIFGSKGQDGSILKEKILNNLPQANLFLFSKNSISQIKNQILQKEILISDSLEYLNLCSKLIDEYPPDFIYYFAAVHISSTEKEIDINSEKMFFTNIGLVSYLLNKCSNSSHNTKFLFTSSSLIFSGSDTSPQSENTIRKPKCNYSKQKVLIEELMHQLSKNQNIKTFVPIMYNHESVKRKNKFFTKKIISFCSKTFHNISKQKQEKITIYNPNSIIDMGYAPEYVDMIYDLTLLDNDGTYIFGSGNPIKVKDFVDEVLKFYGLSKDLIIYKSMNPRFNVDLIGDNRKIYNAIGRSPKIYGRALAKRLCEDYEIYINN